MARVERWRADAVTMASAEPRRHRSTSQGSKASSVNHSPSRSLSLSGNFPTELEPCAATPSLFLYAQGPLILCLHHDTLALERRFAGHRERVQLISVDTVSERDAGRLVVSYDIGQTAIVWDLFNGDEKARFASYEEIKVASWMRNGNVAFGNGKGEVILFEPSTSEHVSARTIFDPITALAPASDCRTYAIGYKNGSILIAGLQPSFTILHTLTTSRGPSPIVSLAWHASSSKQKSDMLATQTSDGDLRVWSVAKPPTKDVPRVIRALRRSDSQSVGAKWLAWSKNGRVVQYSERETWSWDVRTKHVTYEPVPTVSGVHGLACYGPTATLFTLGPNHTVQQYELENPQIVANVQHLPLGIVAPPTPPEEAPVRSIEVVKAPQLAPQSLHVKRDSSETRSTRSRNNEVSGTSRIEKTTLEINAAQIAQQARVDAASPLSSRSGTASMSSRSSGYGPGPKLNNYGYSPSARTGYTGTTFSMGSPQDSRHTYISGTGTSFTSPSTASYTSSRSRHRRGSRLRQEVLPSPEDKPLAELFPYTRGRLHDVPYKAPQHIDDSNLTPDNLRRQMLEVVFGWTQDIEELVRDELSRHSPGSTNYVLLCKWLGEVDADLMANMLATNTMSSSDWMFLALTQMGGQSSTKKIGEAFVQKMLEKGDIHSAATILIGLGEQNDAIEVYVSRNFYMEAILLTCLAFPTDWQRQSYLVRRWGEHVVEHSQQLLAIRCFSCTGLEPSGPWTSPTAQLAVAFTEHAQRAGLLSPTGALLSPQGSLLSPGAYIPAPSPKGLIPQKPIGKTRMTPQNSSLKLVTNFGAQNPAQFKFPGLKSDDRTPTNAPGVTPIAESAISPGGLGSYMKNNARHLKQALTSKSMSMTPGGFPRHRLPSIGETPTDSDAPVMTAPKALPTPVDSGSEKEKEDDEEEEEQEMDAQTALPGNEKQLPLTAVSSKEGSPQLLLSSARYEPAKYEPGKDSKSTPQTALTATGPSFERPISPPMTMLNALKDSSRSRNGSRDRKPEGLFIIPHNESHTESNDEADYPAQPTVSDRTAEAPGLTSKSFQSQAFDGGSEMSPPTTGHSFASSKFARSPGGVSNRSIDQYISSLEEAHFYSRQHHSRRQASRDRRETAEKALKAAQHAQHSHQSHHKSRSKHSAREPSEERGRGGTRYIPPAKRSPSSPLPMSPDDLLYNLSMESLTSPEVPVTVKKATRGRSKPRSASAKGRARSKTGDQRVESRKGSKPTSRAPSRKQSPDPNVEHTSRGRSKLRERRDGSALRSPSSPLPMGPQDSESDFCQKPADFEHRLRLVTVDRERLRSMSRRAHERGSSARRDVSPDRRRPRERSSSRQARERDLSLRRDYPLHSSVREQSLPRYDNVDADIRAAIADQASAERKRKELAAAELEARRLSLARRPSAPPIPHPEEFSSSRYTPERPIPERTRSYTQGSPTSQNGSFSYRMMNRSRTSMDLTTNSDSNSSGRESSSVPYGLPGTPRAMRHPKYDFDSAPAVPDVPDDLSTLNGNAFRPSLIQDEPQRSSSAPVPEKSLPANPPMSPGSPPPVPADLPTHPAFQRDLPPSSLKPKSPVHGRAQSRERPSRLVSPGQAPPGTLGYTPSPPGSAGIEETMRRASKVSQSTMNSNHDGPTFLPELQHLASPPPPPPPPMLMEEPSPASSTGVGTINIAIDDLNKAPKVPSRTGTPVIDVANISKPSSPDPINQDNGGRASAGPQIDHRRGRSLNEGFTNRFKMMADRVRSPSRGRVKSPPIQVSPRPSPYESVPSLEEHMQTKLGQVPEQVVPTGSF